MAFSTTSRKLRLDAGFLEAECKDGSGRYQLSKINLNSYIANVDGQLTWSSGGNFISSSTDLKCVGAATLQATCMKNNGEKVTSKIDLDDAISNRNGSLLCILSNAPGYYSATSKNVSLAGTVLKADCKTDKGDYQESSIDLNDFISNVDGCLEWRNGMFAANCQNFGLDSSSFLLAECKDESGTYYRAAINLDHHIINANGVLQMYTDRLIIKVDEDNVEQVAKELKKYYEANKGKVSAQVADNGEVKYLYVSAEAGKDAGIIFQLSSGAQASIMHIANDQGGIQRVNVDILQAKVNTWAGFGAGVGAHINLISAQAAVFNLTLGIGVDTGIGIKDDALQFKVLGTGLTVGRKVEISVLGSSFGIDFGRLW